MSGFNVSLKIERKFDAQKKRHYLNDTVFVVHCHHYTSLYTQLALDAKRTDLLAETAEDTFYDLIYKYYEKNGIKDINERVDIAVQYYRELGLGKMDVQFIGDYSGEVELTASHVDEGWIKKWGKYDKPVNYITSGFISAMFSAILDMPKGIFEAHELESIVMGKSISRFKISRK